MGIIKTTLFPFLHIYPEERKLAALNFLFSILVGMICNFLYIVPLTFFLVEYPSSFLTYIYIFSGAILSITGFIFSYLQKRLSFFYVLVMIVSILAISIVVFWALFILLKIKGLSIALMLWSTVIQILLVLVYDALTSQIFNLQQGKRLLGMVGTGYSIGASLAGFIIPLLNKQIGSINILLITAILTFTILAILYGIKNNSKEKIVSKKQIENKIFFKNIKSKKFVILIFLLNSLVVFLFYASDLLLNTELKIHFLNPNDILHFLGMISAITYLLYIPAGFFLFRWILKKYGLADSLLVPPIIITAFTAILFFVTLSSSSIDPFIFVLVTLIAISQRILRASISRQSLLLLFQPLRKEERFWAQIKNSTLVNSLATSLIGLILYLIGYLFGLTLGTLSLIIVAICLCTGVLTLSIMKEYVNSLTLAASKRIIINPAFILLDKESLDIFKSSLQSPSPEKVIYILETLETMDQIEFIAAILQSLDHPSWDVRHYCLNKVEQYQIKEAKEKVKKIYLSESNPKVIGNSLLAWAALADPDELCLEIKSPNPEIVTNSLIALIKYGSENQKEQAIQYLIQAATSSATETRLLVAQVCKEITISNKESLLLPLLKDSNKEVRLEACKASSHLTDERIYHSLIENLSIPSFHQAACNSLLSIGMPIFNYILNNFEIFPRNSQFELIRLLGFMKRDANIVAFLKKFITHPERKILYVAIEALRRQAYKTFTEDVEINNLIVSESKNIEILKEFATYFDFENGLLLQGLIRREIEISEEFIFSILTFIYPEDSILKAMEGFTTGNEEMRNYAIEILLNILRKKDSNLIVTQLTSRSSPIQGNIEDYLLRVIDKAPYCVISSIASAAIYTIGIMKLKNLCDFVLNFDAKWDPLFNEVKTWTLQKLKT